MAAGKYDFALAIGGEAGQGIATPGDVLARIFVRRGLNLSTYNAYQSIIRGGHIFLTVRVADQEIFTHGDKLDLLLCLNQDTMDRHLGLMGPGGRVIYNGDAITPGAAPHLVPNEDEEICEQLERSFARQGINVMTGTGVTGVDSNADGPTADYHHPCGPTGLQDRAYRERSFGRSLPQLGLHTQQGLVEERRDSLLLQPSGGFWVCVR